MNCRLWGILFFLLVVSLQTACAQAATTVYVSPASVNAGLNSSFMLAINISTDQSIYAAQLDVYYDKAKLNATDATEGDFLRQGGAGTYPVILNNVSAGRITCANTRIGTANGSTGNGGLFMINFTAIAGGSSSIGLAAVTLVDPNLQAVQASATNGTVNVSSPPSASNLLITPANPKKADSLTGSYTYSDPDGDPESGSEIRWYKNGVLQAAYNNTLVVSSSALAKGQVWYFTVKPKDGMSFGTLQTSPNVTVQNTAPTVPKVKLGPTSPKTTDDLNCNITSQSTDIDGDSITYLYRWYRNGTFQPGFASDMLPGEVTNKSDVWKCVVTPSDGLANGTSDESQVTIVNSAPNITWFAPSIFLLKIREARAFSSTTAQPTPMATR